MRRVAGSRSVLAVLFAPLVALAADGGQPEVNQRVENAVVKVFATKREPDPLRPWTKASPAQVSGSGVVIEGKRILTNAHVVNYASQVQVQASGSGDKLSATVVARAPGIDLAVLKLDDESFFDTHPPLERARTLPAVTDEVMAYGYPTGGTTLSITKGIVSRIEFVPYGQGTSGLRVQVDAAINHGNSGGAAVVADQLIGLTFSTLSNAQNIGYIIPTEEIDLFLKDAADGRYDGKASLAGDYQTLENAALRTYLGLEKTVEGVIVHRPGTGSPLKEWDVLTRIGETKIDNQGMVKLGASVRVNFNYLVQQVAKDGKVPLTIVRAGKEQTLQAPVSVRREHLINDLLGAYPSYFVYGPVVFTAGTTLYLGHGKYPDSPLVTRRSDLPAFEGEELVLVSSPFLPHKLTKGYDSAAGQAVKSVNGVAIKNLRHLVEVLRDSREDFVVIAFVEKRAPSIVLPRKDVLAANEEILADNDVRAQASPELLTLWEARAAK